LSSRNYAAFRKSSRKERGYALRTRNGENVKRRRHLRKPGEMQGIFLFYDAMGSVLLPCVCKILSIHVTLDTEQVSGF
jgi:hypothetical protein